jgi:homoserine kinase
LPSLRMTTARVDRRAPEAMHAAPEIVVPGSISNLGPGFDALAVAVRLYLRVQIVEVLPDSPGTFETEFSDSTPPGENRIETAYRRAAAWGSAPAPGLRVRVRSEIPMRAGLGSSGAAIVAGLRLYEAVTGSGSVDEWHRIATGIEGHPDNAAASLLGGLTVSCQHEDGRVTARAWPWPSDLQFVVATPDVELDTTLARRALPATLSLGDGIFNLQHALLLIRAIETGRHGDLREALRDRWHQPARAPLVPGLRDALALDDPAVLGVCLSGAGPSIVVLAATDPSGAAAALRGVYTRLNVPCTIRTLAAHQPHLDERSPALAGIENPS